MLFELIATFSAGFVAGGIVFILNRLTGQRLPRWLMPVAAGTAMIGFQIWTEYTWFDRTTQGLPEGIVVTRSYQDPAMYRPWSYVFPQTTRFMAVDTENLRHHADYDEMILANILLFQRRAPVSAVPQIYNCATSARGDVTDVTDFSSGDLLDSVSWRSAEDDPNLGALCGG